MHAADRQLEPLQEKRVRTVLEQMRHPEIGAVERAHEVFVRADLGIENDARLLALEIDDDLDTPGSSR